MALSSWLALYTSPSLPESAWIDGREGVCWGQKNEEIHFHIDHSVAPVAAPYRPIPLAYQEKLSAHLQELQKADKIEDVKPQEHTP